MTAMRVDVHQHLWTEPILAALARRDAAPRLVRRDRSWVLEIAGEPDSPVTPAYPELRRRVLQLGTDDVDRALLCPSLPLGVESLPADEAHAVLDAYHQGVGELPDRFAAWGSVPARDPDPAAVDRLLDGGIVGLAVPAGALVGQGGAGPPGPPAPRR